MANGGLYFGFVVAQEPETGRVRVDMSARDGLGSYWVYVLSPGTGKDKWYCMPDIGEHVAVQMAEDMVDGVVLGSIYSARDAVPITDPAERHIRFSDGTVVRYNRDTHEMQTSIPSGRWSLVVGTSKVILDDEVITLITDLLRTRIEMRLGVTDEGVAPLVALDKHYPVAPYPPDWRETGQG